MGCLSIFLRVRLTQINWRQFNTQPLERLWVLGSAPPGTCCFSSPSFFDCPTGPCSWVGYTCIQFFLIPRCLLITFAIDYSGACPVRLSTTGSVTESLLGELSFQRGNLRGPYGQRVSPPNVWPLRPVGQGFKSCRGPESYLGDLSSGSTGFLLVHRW